MKSTVLNFVFLSLSLFTCAKEKHPLQIGFWTGKLQLHNNIDLPFKFQISKISKKYHFTIFNGKEKIELEDVSFKNDSIYIDFPHFYSSLVLKQKNKNQLIGYWVNKNKSNNYKIPCKIAYNYKHRFENPKLYLQNVKPSNFNGKWETSFNPNTKDQYKAIGIFQQQKNSIEGTFLTETGDYRFLEGNCIGDSLYLSGFDGSHAFLFTGHLKNDSIYGTFYSGNHWKTNWISIKNDNFQLSNPESITYKKADLPFSFTVKDTSGNYFTFQPKEYINKVTIIQIMGSWCPNCMDEMNYLTHIYHKYKQSGLELISVAYETGNNEKTQVEKLRTLSKKLELKHLILLGGTANKNLASQQFSSLNQISSFPTTIFLDKKGEVRKIITGFNGPGTGKIYNDFIIENTTFIEDLLKE